MIKIIAGTFGYYDGEDGKKVRPITAADGPIELNAALEKELVDKKVAVYVTKQAGQGKEGGGLPAYNEDMKLADLKEIAKAYGVDASDARKKADVIDLIEAAQAEDADEDEDAPPSFDVEPPVIGS